MRLSRKLIEDTLGYKPSTYVDICKVAEILNVSATRVYEVYVRLPISNIYNNEGIDNYERIK